MPRALEKYKAFARGVFGGETGAAAARAAGYADGPALSVTVARLMKQPEVVAELERLRGAAEAAAVFKRQELLDKLAAQARGEWAEYLEFDEVENGAGGKRLVWTGLDVARMKRDGKAWLLEGLELTKEGGIKFKVAGAQGAFDRIAKLEGFNAPEKHEHELKGRPVESMSEAEMEAELRGLSPRSAQSTRRKAKGS